MPLKHSVHEVSLKNGAKGLIIDIPGATAVSYQIYFRAGYHYVAKEERHETAHIMEHMAFGANAQFNDMMTFSQEFRKNGAYFNASTWGRGMCYYVDAPLMEWDRILDLLSLAITQPVFKQDNLLAEQGNVREELTRNLDNHHRTLARRVTNAMGEDLPPESVWLATVDNVTLADIRRHHSQTHTTRNMRFVIAGDLANHHEAIREKFESWGLERGALLPLKPLTLHKAPLQFVRRNEMSNIRFMLKVGLNRQLLDIENDAMGMLNHILTGTFHSRIFGKARAMGICYAMSSRTSTDIDDTSEWEFSGQTATQNMDALVALIKHELRTVAQTGVSEEEIEAAKRYSLGQYQMYAQTVAEIANWYAGDYFDDKDTVLLRDVPRLLDRVTTPLVIQLVNEFFSAGIWTFGVIGNTAKPPINKLHEELAEIFTSKVK